MKSKTAFSALKLRKSQLITGFGVGAIVDIDNQSLIGKDISTWHSDITKNKKYRLDKIPRLEKLLGIDFVLEPPSAPSELYGNAPTRLSVPYYRFPQWLECRKCKALKKYDDGGNRYQQDFSKIICHGCGASSKNLSPIRYIFAPEDGCIDDIDWPFVLHVNTQSNACTDKDNLQINTIKGKGGGLSSVEIKCNTCKVKKNMNQIKQDLYVQTSKGVQPWEFAAAMSNPPKQNPQHSSFQLRGATSLYQPQIVGGLDLSGSQWETEDINSINDFLDGNEEIETLKDTLEIFKDAPPDKKEKLYSKFCKILNEDKPNELDNISVQDIKDYLSKTDSDERLHDVNLQDVSDENLKIDEFELLNTDGHQIYKNYDGEKYKITDSNLSSYIESVTQIKKLREVRVLKGYTRFFNAKFHSVNSSDKRLPFLPGYEVFGEGFFIQFNINSVEKWQQKFGDDIHSRLSEMQQRQQNAEYLPFPSAKFVLVHTFSHLLIKQLCFQSGYQAASIKERLYVNDSKGMCGVLIYTADADSEGSLGGLVRMSDEKRLADSIRSMLDTAGWCSADPTCIEIGSPGTRGLNKAACHACSLISETSCANMNALLDRGLLIGSKSENLKGYFDQ